MNNLITRYVDCVELAGNNNIVVPMVGRLLYKRLVEQLTELPESGVLFIDFSRVHWVDSSTLLISVAKLLAFTLKNHWPKTIVCCETTEAHRKDLSAAIGNWPYASVEWTESRKLLLLATDRKSTTNWSLLGLEELSQPQRDIWSWIEGKRCVSAKMISERLGISKKEVRSRLEVFFDNCILVEQKGEICHILDLLNLYKEGN